MNSLRPGLFLLSLSLAACAGRERRDTAGSQSPPPPEAPDASPAPAALDAATPAVLDAALDALLLEAAVALPAAADAEAPRAARPLYYERELTAEDLAGRTLRELALLRNTPYARQGHTFRRPWLQQYFSAQSWYQPRRVIADTELSPRDLHNAREAGRFDTSLTRAALEALATALQQRNESGRLLEGDEVEAVLLSQRLGRSIAVSRAAPASQRGTPLEEPSRLDSVLDRAELLQLSPRDLWILRNMVFARRGRPFRSSILQEYFSNTDWYHADNGYTDARLQRVDRQNLRMIESVQTEVGGVTNARLEADRVMQGA